MFFFSCATKDQKQWQRAEPRVSLADTTLKGDTLQRYRAAPAASIDGDTLTIDQASAVFYQPDSLQIEKRKRQVGEGDFRAGMDDYIYYINTSAEYLEKRGLPVMDAKNRTYLRFVMADRNEQLIKLDTLKELWGMYLFDPGKKPFYADIVEIEEAYQKYFDR